MDRKLSKRIAKSIDYAMSSIIYIICIFVVGYNIFIYSNVALKIQNPLNYLLLIGNFCIFILFISAYKKHIDNGVSK